MKKRCTCILVMLLLCALLGTSLCGCDVIDELRAGNATVLDERSVEWNGTIYKRMDALQTTKVEVCGVDLDCSLYINEDDVPALLLSVFCAEYHPTDNNVFLCGVNYDLWSAGLKPIEMEGRAQAYFYCREDRFDEVARQLRDGLELTGYLYQYYDYETSDDCVYLLKDDEMAALEKVVSSAYRWGTEVYDYDFSTRVYACTEDGLLDNTKYYNVLKDGDVYYVGYLSDYASGEEYWWSDGSTEYYRVPRELNDEFERMLKVTVDTQVYWQEQYDERLGVDDEAIFEESTL